MTLAQIQALGVQTAPQLIRATDTGIYYLIDVGQSGGDALPYNGTLTNGTISGTLAAGVLTTDATTKTNLRNALGETVYLADSDSATRANNTLASDSVLFDIPLEANSCFKIEFSIAMSATSTNGYKWNLDCGGALSAAIFEYYGWSSYPAGLFQFVFTQASGISSLISRTASADRHTTFGTIYINTTTARLLALKWAQNTTDGAQTTTRKAGSWIRVTRLH